MDYRNLSKIKPFLDLKPPQPQKPNTPRTRLAQSLANRTAKRLSPR